MSTQKSPESLRAFNKKTTVRRTRACGKSFQQGHRKPDVIDLAFISFLVIVLIALALTLLLGSCSHSPRSPAPTPAAVEVLGHYYHQAPPAR